MDNVKIKIAVYARVSTEMIEQDQSYQAQLQYFTEKFKDIYEIVEVYADKGSGLSLKKRPMFQKMLKDSGLEIEQKRGKTITYASSRPPKFKYILTKSVSRFSRNSEITTIIRDLKSKGVFIIFDDVNKSTESAEDTMLLEFLQSMAQEESRNKSQIVKWGKKRSAENGHVSLQANIYGYKPNLEENTLRIIPEEAEVIKKIFNLAFEGAGARKIKRLLTEQNIFNSEGKPFSETHLLYILKNPKYCGLNVRNRWEKTDLYNSNKQKEREESEWIIQETDKIDKIIEKEIFDKVQELILGRSSAKRGIHLAQGELAGKIRCSICGAFYTRNREVYKNGNVRVFYNCSTKKKKGLKACNSRNVGQDEVEEYINVFLNSTYYEEAFEIKINNYIEKIDNRISYITEQISNINLEEISELKSKIKVEENKIEILLENMLENTSDTFKNIYARKTKSIEEKLTILEKRLKELETTEDEKTTIIKNLDEFKRHLLNIKIYKFTSREDFLNNVLFFYVYQDNYIRVWTLLDSKFKYLDSAINGDIELKDKLDL